MNKFLEKFKDRYSILVLILSGVFLVFTFKLISLTLINGEEFRALSNTKRLKEIPIPAPRGEIRDRYGRLLAGNKVSFAVQLIKDELNNSSDVEDRNETILKLIHILNAEGTTYTDEFPILFNTYKYVDDDIYSETGIDPIEKVANTIVESNLISNLIETSMEYSNDVSVPKFITAKKAINILENEGLVVPVEVDYDENENLNFAYDERENIAKWQKENQIVANSDPKNAIIQAINNKSAKKIVMKMIKDPIVSKLAYDILNSRGLVEDIKLEPISLKYDEEYRLTKKDLMNEFNNITMKSSAIDDFISILESSNGIEELLSQTFTKEDESDSKKDIVTVPGEIMLEKMKENKIKLPIKVSVDESSKKPIYKYKNDKEKEELIKTYKLDKNIKPLDALIKIADKEVVKEKSKKNQEKSNAVSIKESFIKDVRIKGLAQGIVLKNYSNPKISISEWEYTPITEKKSWLNRYDLNEKDDIEENFKILKKNLKLSSELTDYETRGALLIIDELNKVGYRGYYPINIAYGINDKTVAKLEENKLDLPGVKVSLEPIRYYPEGETASHILGYMGKIAQQEEIDKYIKEKGYLPSTLIGKTGVEVQFEDYLKGEDGSRIVEADAHGNIVKLVEEKPAKPGNTLYLTIDSELQKTAEESLEKTLRGIRGGGSFESEWGTFRYGKTYPNAYTGSAVALDAKTGQALAIANYPGYDPNLFATGISSEDWKSLNPDNDESGLPLYNIALSSPVQPGSTFKMVTGLAGLENGIEASKKIYDYGYVQVGNTKFECLIWTNGRGTHGATDIYKAIEKSCNYYFYSVALGRIPTTGEVLGKGMDVDKVIETAKKLGLNEKTGIEIPGERILGVPDTYSKTRTTKVLLERFLKSQIDDFIKEDRNLSEKDITDAIDEIASWVELEEKISKREVINRLDKLGIDGEKKIPGSAKDLADSIKYDYLNASSWDISDTLNISIGQGENAYTPLQMANYMSIIANGGYKHQVSVVDRIQTFDNTKKTYETKIKSERIQLNNYKNLEEIGKGMARVTQSEGTARMAFSGFPVEVAAKTGTAERAGISPVSKRKYDNYAWFTAYAPYEENNMDAPQIAISVVIFQGGSGGYASPVVREIIAEYLGLNKEEEKLNKLDFNTKLTK